MLKIFTGALLIAALLSGQVAQAEDSPSRRPLFLFLLLHNDIEETSTARIAEDYLIWLVKDLESFTGRRVQLQFISDVPGVTDFAYKSTDSDAIYNAWRQRADQYINARNLPRNGTTKYLLLTQEAMDSNTLGLSAPGSHTGMASLGYVSTAAHELGHMLGGTHESAEILYRGAWWCETNLVAVHQSYRQYCKVYSDENKRRIAEDLSQYP
ncbi:hypothetical protein BZK31_12595 [Pseudomonas floridensis]|uniref:Uncharacterized protein n=1 Tax=Pseudomonas floridensis TaxID=1958950 RepID=A0A1X0N6N4_9PSED|nr:hypothetical protein [Pseudomonas floridensis]ORC59004.1 hypothetical protein BZK31_12595 [Pseudomonas floridensis]